MDTLKIWSQPTVSLIASEINHLNLHVKHRIRANDQSKGNLHIMGQAFLVALLNRRPFGAESLVLRERQQALQLRQVFQPDSLFKFKRLRNKGAQFRVALIKPTTRSN